MIPTLLLGGLALIALAALVWCVVYAIRARLRRNRLRPLLGVAETVETMEARRGK